MPHTYKGHRLGTYKRPKNSPTLATIRQSPSPVNIRPYKKSPGNKYVVTKKVGRFTVMTPKKSPSPVYSKNVKGRFTILTKLVPVKRGRFTVYYRPS